MAKLLCICGKIGCGKTYYANRLKEQEHAVILSTDEVTYDLTDNQQGEGYDEFARRVNLYLRTPLYKFFNKKSIVQDFLMYNEFATTITKESDPVR